MAERRGYDTALAAVNADASIGKITVAGDWRASSVLVGADDAGAKLVAPTDTSRFSQIASIVIKGQVLGTATAGDSFGIFAEHIVAAKIGGAALKLDKGERDAADAFALSPFPGIGGANSDLFLREAIL